MGADDLNFNDQVVLVTGAGKGLGRALARAFAAQGACLAANDLIPTNLDNTLAQIAAAGGQAHPYVADVSGSLQVGALLARIEEDWGRLDILVNNAAVAPRAELLSMDEWDWQRVLDVNLSGPFWLMRSAALLMRAHGGGTILNLTARPAWLERLPQHSAYQASQWGLLGLTRAAAKELRADHIRVNALCLGALSSPIESVDPADQPRLYGEGDGEEPSTDLEKVVARVLWLCSPAGSHLTGQILDIEEGVSPWQAGQNPPSPIAT
jgi:NAD(P)-dependent dehydrogenase (short-subunit alcohol dehydrogenase family)